jgi:hypothetical protein
VSGGGTGGCYVFRDPARVTVAPAGGPRPTSRRRAPGSRTRTPFRRRGFVHVARSAVGPLEVGVHRSRLSRVDDTDSNADFELFVMDPAPPPATYTEPTRPADALTSYVSNSEPPALIRATVAARNASRSSAAPRFRCACSKASTSRQLLSVIVRLFSRSTRNHAPRKPGTPSQQPTTTSSKNRRPSSTVSGVPRTRFRRRTPPPLARSAMPSLPGV